MIEFIKNRLHSFRFAWNGIVSFLRTEAQAKVHLFLAVIAVSLSFYFNITSIEWLAIVVAIGIVLISEMLNTSIEKIVDMISPEFNESARFIKDVAAGAVLLASIVSVIIGCIVFLKYIV